MPLPCVRRRVVRSKLFRENLTQSPLICQLWYLLHELCWNQHLNTNIYNCRRRRRRLRCDIFIVLIWYVSDVLLAADVCIWHDLMPLIDLNTENNNNIIQTKPQKRTKAYRTIQNEYVFPPIFLCRSIELTLVKY